MRIVPWLGWLPMMLVCTLAQARPLEIVGRYGYTGEWEITATLAPADAASSAFSGPFRMRHLATCLPGEVKEKTGELRISRAADGRHYTADMSLGGSRCAFSGVLSETGISFVDCAGFNQIPLRMWAR